MAAAKASIFNHRAVAVDALAYRQGVADSIAFHAKPRSRKGAKVNKRRQEKEGLKELLLQSINDASDAVFKIVVAEVNKQTEFHVGQPQVGK